MNTLFAAATKVDITPYFIKKTYLAGFMPNRIATGVAEPLTARVLYLEDDDGPFVLVTADLIGLMLPDVDGLKSKVIGISPERICFVSTHTHSGPDMLGIWGPSVGEIPYRSGRDPEYLNWLMEQVSSGIARAESRKRPALIGFAENKEEKGDWVINIRQPGYNDQVMSVMRVDGTDGEPIACLTNFACHPEILWEHNTEISPDFVHYLHKKVEETTGALSLFANGALGGMVTTVLPDETVLAERKSHVKRMGKALGKMAASSWAAAKPKPVKQIDHRSARFLAPFDNKELHFATHIGVINRKLQRGMVETCVHAFNIGPAQFITLPGEPLPSVGFAAKKMMSGKPNFLFGLGDDELGYLIDYKQGNDDHYSYERSVSIGPKGTEAILAKLSELTKSP